MKYSACPMSSWMSLCCPAGRSYFAQALRKYSGEFKIKGENLIVELAQIDGGEGVLSTLISLVSRLNSAAP